MKFSLKPTSMVWHKLIIFKKIDGDGVLQRTLVFMEENPDLILSFFAIIPPMNCFRQKNFGMAVLSIALFPLERIEKQSRGTSMKIFLKEYR